jgi:hypothetical protein
MAFLMQILAMMIGIALVVWGRAVLAAGHKDFSWRIFFDENMNRVVLCVVGAVIIAAAGFIDAAGLQTALSKLPFAIQAGSGLSIGISIATVAIVAVPATLGRDEPPST